MVVKRQRTEEDLALIELRVLKWTKTTWNRNEGVCLLQEDKSVTRSCTQNISQSPSKDS